MPDYNVISNVSETLVSFLTEALKVLDPAGTVTAPTALLHDLHERPEQANGQNRAGVVAVTLVEAREDPTSRNRPRQGSAQGQRIDLTKPSMAILLRYLMTPWSFDETAGTGGRILEQRMLGRVAQVLYDNAIISGDDLEGKGETKPHDPQIHFGLEGSDEALKVKLAPLTFEEQTRFWHVVKQPYRPSLTYDVRVVNLAPTKVMSDSLVVSREVEYGVLERS